MAMLRCLLREQSLSNYPMKEKRFGVGREQPTKSNKYKHLDEHRLSLLLFQCSQLFETIRTVKRGDIIYAIIDPDDEAQKPFFSIVAIDGETGQEISTTKVPCDMNYDNIGYIGNYLFWTEEHAIKWTSIEKVDIKSTSLKVGEESSSSF